MNKISERMRELRIDNGKEKEELAALLGVTTSSYNRYESGARELDVDSLIKLAIFYGVPLDYLLGRDGIEMPVFDRSRVVCYKDLIDLGFNGKLAHGIISQIDSKKPFEERIRRSVDDKTKFVEKEEIFYLLMEIADLV